MALYLQEGYVQLRPPECLSESLEVCNHLPKRAASTAGCALLCSALLRGTWASER